MIAWVHHALRALVGFVFAVCRHNHSETGLLQQIRCIMANDYMKIDLVLSSHSLYGNNIVLCMSADPLVK